MRKDRERPPVHVLVRQLRSVNVKIACAAARQLGSLGRAVTEHPAATRGLLRALELSDAKVRTAASRALKRLVPYLRHSHEVLSTLAKMATHGPIGSRETAVDAASTLARFGRSALEHPAVTRLFDWWQRADTAIWWPGGVDLARILFHEHLNPNITDDALCLRLIERWRRGASCERITALRIVLARHRTLLHHAAAMDVVRCGLRDERDDVRQAAVSAVVVIGRDERNDHGLREMVEALRSTIPYSVIDPHDTYGYDVDLRFDIQAGLAAESGRIAQDRGALSAIEAGLKGDDKGFRWECTELLRTVAVEAGANHAVSVLLLGALLNWDPDVRRIAAATLTDSNVKIDRSPDVVSLLELVREHGASDVREIRVPG